MYVDVQYIPAPSSRPLFCSSGQFTQKQTRKTMNQQAKICSQMYVTLFDGQKRQIHKIIIKFWLQFFENISKFK